MEELRYPMRCGSGGAIKWLVVNDIMLRKGIIGGRERGQRLSERFLVTQKGLMERGRLKR